MDGRFRLFDGISIRTISSVICNAVCGIAIWTALMYGLSMLDACSDGGLHCPVTAYN